MSYGRTDGQMDDVLRLMRPSLALVWTAQYRIAA